MTNDVFKLRILHTALDQSGRTACALVCVLHLDAKGQLNRIRWALTPCCLLAAGGILFKVYVIGDEVNVVKRLSLPDMEDGKEEDDIGVRSFSRVSSAAASLNEAGFEAVSKTAGK